MQRFWIVALPGVLFLLWYVGWGRSQQISAQALLGAPQYAADAGAGAAAGLAGLSSAWGPPLAVVGAAVAIGARRRPSATSALLPAAIAGAFVFWGLAAITRADAAEPAASRYLYIGAVFILLVAAEASVQPRLSRVSLAVICTLVAAAVVANISDLRTGERALRPRDESVRASLAAVEIAAPVVARSFVPEPISAPQISAGPYLAAVRDLGSPALTVAQLSRAPEGTRINTDMVLEQAEAIRSTPTAGRPTGTRTIDLARTSAEQLMPMRGCVHFTPVGPQAFLDVRLPPGDRLTLHSDSAPGAQLIVRRFASSFAAAPLAVLNGGTSAVVRFPMDRAPAHPWLVRIASARPLQACEG